MKTIFWNVDTQYDFMRNDESFKGALAIPGARTIEANLEKLTQYAREKGVTVVNTADWHTHESKEFSEKPDFKTTFPPHCLQVTQGASYVPATNPENPYIIGWQQKSFDKDQLLRNRNIVLYKDAFDIFAGSPHTERVLEVLNPRKAVVYGVATNVCVNYAVLGLLERGVGVSVPLDAIREIPGLPLEDVLLQWMIGGVKFRTTRDVLEGKI